MNSLLIIGNIYLAMALGIKTVNPQASIGLIAVIGFMFCVLGGLVELHSSVHLKRETKRADDMIEHIERELKRASRKRGRKNGIEVTEIKIDKKREKE